MVVVFYINNGVVTIQNNPTLNLNTALEQQSNQQMVVVVFILVQEL
jgi:hypothetical protein